MSDAVKYRELRIDIGNGVTLVVDVATKADVEAALKELADFGVTLDKEGGKDVRDEDKPAPQAPVHGDTPDARLELRADLLPGSLRKKNILVFKDGIPQLLRPSSFPAVSDAALILIFSVEAGLKKPSLTFDEFRALYDAQNIKSGSPMSMLLNNLKNSNYIDKVVYGRDRTVRLTGKGEKKATEVLVQMSR